MYDQDDARVHADLRAADPATITGAPANDLFSEQGIEIKPSTTTRPIRLPVSAPVPTGNSMCSGVSGGAHGFADPGPIHSLFVSSCAAGL